MNPVTAPAATPLRHVEPVMGTVFSFDVRPSPGQDEQALAAIAEAVEWLHWVDATFSTYRTESQISRLDRGELRVEACDPRVAEVLELCELEYTASGGYFSSVIAGRLDPSGLVKGWSIEHASQLLRSHGCADHAINGGGDVRAVGEPSPGSLWQIGVTHPLQPDALTTVISGSDLAVATSGTAERGSHIRDPFTGQPPVGQASITVVGSDLTRVDCVATAAFAMGPDAQTWLEGLNGFEAYAVTEGGLAWWTSGFPRYGTVPAATSADATGTPAHSG